MLEKNNGKTLETGYNFFTYFRGVPWVLHTLTCES